MNVRKFRHLIFLAMFTCAKASAVSLIYLDFDGTQVENRASKSGAFDTSFRLFRIEERLSLLQTIPAGEKFIDVGTQDFKRLKKHFAQDIKTPGSLAMRATLSDGRKFSPGEYYVRYPETYYRFMPGEQGENYLVEDYLAAQAKVKSEGRELRGPLWPVMQMWLSNPDSASRFSRLSARGNSAEEWREFDRLLLKEKHIRFAPEPEHNFMVADPRFERFGPTQQTAVRKIGVLREVILQLLRTNLTDDDIRSSPDDVNEKRKLHVLTFADDDPENLDLAAVLFEEFARKGAPIKFILLNAGTSTEIRESKRPQYSVATSLGTWRNAQGSEIWGEPFSEKTVLSRQIESTLSQKPQLVGSPLRSGILCQDLFN